MIDVLGAWCIKLVGAGLISSVILAVCPEGKSKSSVKFACSLMCLIVFVSAIKNVDYSELSKMVGQINYEASRQIEDGVSSANNETRFIIEEQIKAYILGKEEFHGLDVEVITKWSSEGFWYPYEAEITGTVEEEKKSSLKYILEMELGIPEERVKFK